MVCWKMSEDIYGFLNTTSETYETSQLAMFGSDPVAMAAMAVLL